MTTGTDARPHDPHASKISPDDPRLRPRRSKSRYLRKGPTILALSAVLGAVVVSVVWAVEPRERRTREDTVSDLRTRLPQEIVDAPDVVPPAAPNPQDAGTPPRELPAQAPLYDIPTAKPAARHAAAAAPKDDEALKARRSGVFVMGRALGDVPGDDAPARAGRARADQDEDGAARVRRSLERAQRAVSELQPQGPSYEADDSDDDFMQASADRGDGYLHARVQRPRSPYEVKAGTIIPAVLQTAINSDLKGPVFARVRENVYDSLTHEHILIPQNSTLIAAYDARIAWGQQRVLLCWQRIIFPDQSSISLDCMPGADLTGAAGLTDEVDEHWMRLAKGAALASLLSAGTTAAAGNTQGYYPSVPQQFARGAAAEFGRAGEHITRRELMVQPTITIRPGWSMNVLVTKDMILEPFPDDNAAAP